MAKLSDMQNSWIFLKRDQLPRNGEVVGQGGALAVFFSSILTGGSLLSAVMSSSLARRRER
jgi:hypothetical protein